jgi:hypothetical protein
MSCPVVDPHLIRFVEQVSAGANAAADSIAGLLLRLLGRVGSLEKTVQAQASKLDELARQPKPARARTHDGAAVKVETGVDMAGNPVRHEIPVKRPRGRPAGHRDAAPRVRRWRHKPEGRGLYHREDLEAVGGLVAVELPVLDPDWDV